MPELVTAVGTPGVALIDAAFPGQAAEAEKRAGDGAAVDGARAGGAAGHPQGAGRASRCRQTGDRTERRERFCRTSAIVWKAATVVEMSGARASPSPLTCKVRESPRTIA